MEKIENLKQFVIKHRAKLAVGVTVAAFILLIQRNRRVLDEFLKEHDLYDEYWKSEE